MESALQLARVKFSPPNLTEELVRRTRLLQRLDAGIQCPVTLIAAPAGYGKSTLLASWLKKAPIPAAWLSLDEDDNDLNLFAAYLVAAIRTIFPGALQSSNGSINSAVTFDPSHLATTLSNDIAELPSKFILILDDYHLIKNRAVHSLTGHLIRLLPDQLRLVISTRTDSPLPLARLRARGELCELRARDLRFSLEEARTFLEQTVGVKLPTGAIQQIQDRTEGWVAALRFASLLLREGSKTPEVIERLVSHHERPLIEYLLDEVVVSLRPSAQDLLLKTSLFDQFSVGLCEAVLNRQNSENSLALVDDLVKNETLTVVEGDVEPWYHCHHLFQAYLRTRAQARYDAATIAELHRRASQWYAAHDLITEAIQHAIAAGDLRDAARLVAKNIHTALNREAGRPVIEQWLGLFPPGVEDRQLELVIARLWLLTIQIKLAGLPALIQRAEQLLEQATDLDLARQRTYLAEIAFARQGIALWTNQAALAVEIGSEFYASLPVAYEFARGNMLAEQALALQMTGRTDLALQLLTDALKQDPYNSPGFIRRLNLGFGGVHLNSADLGNMAESAERMLRLDKEDTYLNSVWAHYFLGIANYEWNNLEAAAQHFASAAELRYVGNLKVSHESLARLAQTQQAQGHSEAAAATMKDLSQFTAEMRSGALEYDQAGYRARLALMQGNVKSALQWTQSVTFNPNPHMIFEVEANLTRLCTLLATGKADSIRTMLEETDSLLKLAESLNSTRRVIQLSVLQALARDALGKRELALKSLSHSLRLAEPGGFLRTYIDLGSGMTGLLELLLARNEYYAYIRRILDAASNTEKKTQAPREKPDTPSPLIEPLTLREMQVLEQLALRLSDKEIAQVLVISPLTVKAHKGHIYQKLAVNNRRQAVRVALDYGILTPSSDGFPSAKDAFPQRAPLN